MTRHPALRLPGHEGPVPDGPWHALPRSPEGVPLLISPAEDYLAQVGSDWNVPLDTLSYPALSHLARYLPHLRAQRTALRRAIRSFLGHYVPTRVPLAVEAGCSVGPDLRALRRVAEHVIAFDSYIVPLRAAAQVLAGREVQIPVRVEGRTFQMHRHPLVGTPLKGFTLCCANALDPPLQAESTDLVMAMNLLDNVSEPLNLVGQLDAILKPGGLLMLGSPFNWVDTITPVPEQLGGGNLPAFTDHGTAVALPQILRGETEFFPHLDYELLEEVDVPWRVREHARCSVQFNVRLIVARKRGGT